MLKCLVCFVVLSVSSLSYGQMAPPAPAVPFPSTVAPVNPPGTPPVIAPVIPNINPTAQFDQLNFMGSKRVVMEQKGRVYDEYFRMIYTVAFINEPIVKDFEARVAFWDGMPDSLPENTQDQKAFKIFVKSEYNKLSLATSSMRKVVTPPTFSQSQAILAAGNAMTNLEGYIKAEDWTNAEAEIGYFYLSVKTFNGYQTEFWKQFNEASLRSFVLKDIFPY